MRVRVRKIGSSLAVRIPKSLAEEAHLREGAVVDLSFAEGRVVARPEARQAWTLDQLLDGVTRRNRPALVDFGPSIGREAW